MKITIPEEYREYFTEDIAFLRWWKRPALLLMNQEENKSFQETQEKGAWMTYKDGNCEHISLRIPVVKLAIKNGTIDIPIPENPTRRLQGENRTFTKVSAGIVLS